MTSPTIVCETLVFNIIKGSAGASWLYVWAHPCVVPNCQDCSAPDNHNAKYWVRTGVTQPLQRYVVFDRLAAAWKTNCFGHTTLLCRVHSGASHTLSKCTKHVSACYNEKYISLGLNGNVEDIVCTSLSSVYSCSCSTLPFSPLAPFILPYIYNMKPPTGRPTGRSTDKFQR